MNGCCCYCCFLFLLLLLILVDRTCAKCCYAVGITASKSNQREKSTPFIPRLVVNQADVQESDDMINDALGGEGCGGSFKMAG